MTCLSVVAIVTLLGGTAWTLPPLVQRRFRDPMRLHLCLALFLMGLGNVLSQPPVLHRLDGGTFAGFTKITYNVAILIGLCLMVGFLRERPLGRGKLALESVVCLICLAVMLVMTVLLPPTLRNHGLTSEYLADWRVRTFYNFGNAYLLFGYAACGVLAARHARRGGLLRRLSLTAICIGLVGLSLSCVFRFLWVNVTVLRGPGHLVTYNDDFVFGEIDTILVCVGLSLPCFVGIARMARERNVHRSQFRGLEELWSRLVEFYPELVLDHRGSGWPRLPRMRYASAVYRRYIECRDGLIRLSPMLHLASAQEPGLFTAGDPKASARIVDRALGLLAEKRASDALPTAPSAFVPAGLSGDDYESDLLNLIRLSEDLQELRPSGGTLAEGMDQGARI